MSWYSRPTCGQGIGAGAKRSTVPLEKVFRNRLLGLAEPRTAYALLPLADGEAVRAWAAVTIKVGRQIGPRSAELQRRVFGCNVRGDSLEITPGLVFFGRWSKNNPLSGNFRGGSLYYRRLGCDRRAQFPQHIDVFFGARKRHQDSITLDVPTETGGGKSSSSSP